MVLWEYFFRWMGLLYENNEAINEIKNADYLWISHFHADHFNLLTLKNL